VTSLGLSIGDIQNPKDKIIVHEIRRHKWQDLIEFYEKLEVESGALEG